MPVPPNNTTMNNKTISFHSSTVHYRVQGEGEPLVLLHGFAEDSRIWEELAEKLSTESKLIIPDLPGSGDSTFLEGEHIRLTHYAELIAAILPKKKLMSALWWGTVWAVISHWHLLKCIPGN